MSVRPAAGPPILRHAPMEHVVLKPEHIEEIFLAFIGAGDLVPSAKLLAALGAISGKSETDMRDWYRSFARSLASTAADPFDH